MGTFTRRHIAPARLLVMLSVLASALLTSTGAGCAKGPSNRGEQRGAVTPVTLAAGPYKMVDLGDGTSVPLYLIPFDKNGACEAPQTRAHLVTAARDGAFTDVFILSHGWNNDWAAATRYYDAFLARYQRMRRERGLKYDRPVRPLFVGVIWPSTALVWDSERGPRMASVGGPAASDDAAVDQERRELQAVADLLAPADAERLYALSQKPKMTEAEGAEMAGLLAPLYTSTDDELRGDVPAPSREELLAYWKGIAPEVSRGAGTADDASGDFGAATDPAATRADEPAAAGGLSLPSARDVIRMFTVWRMKDRAGTVGTRGVGPLLDDVLGAGDARVHLLGHSYGGKVVLSALCAGDKPRPVNSVLLLQPAVSALCFAANVDRTGRPGGYRKALDGRVEQPIFSTFSRQDVPLTCIFHLALRRRADLGEARIAAGAPSKFAALGGFGPQGLGPAESQVVVMKDVGDRYTMGGPKVHGLRGDQAITGHGDIVNDATAWALYCQVAQP